MKNKLYLVTIAVLLLIILILFTCNKCGKPKNVSKDTISVKIRIDTVKVHDTIQSYLPVPQNIYVPRVITNTRIDSFVTYETKNIDTAAILKDYYSVVTYSDSKAVKYGNVTINDTISRNRILARGLITDFNIPVVTETITLRQPKRAVLYLGFSVQGNKTNLLFSSGVDLSFKFRNDRILSVGANYTVNSDLFYELGFKFPIRLRKQ